MARVWTIYGKLNNDRAYFKLERITMWSQNLIDRSEYIWPTKLEAEQARARIRKAIKHKGE